MAPIYRYPQKRLEKNTDYVKIDAYIYEPPKLNLLSGNSFTFKQNSSDDTYSSLGSKEIQGTVILPIPQNLPTNTQSTSWGEGKMGPAETLALGVAQKTVEGKNFAGSLVSGLVNAALGIKDAAKTSIGQKAAQSYFASAAVGQLLGQGDLFNNVLARQTGAVFNENIELLFRGLNLRPAFGLEFDLAPRDDKEAQEIRNMVVFLKKAMSARKGNEKGAAAGLFLKAPNVFKVQYMSGGKPHPFLNKFKICALTDLAFNFTSSNTYATYSDGTPVHMNLGLTFQELTPIYESDYDYPERNETGVGY
jgi:hypothetical protein